MLKDKVFYKYGQDNRLCHVLQLELVPIILHELHSGVGGGHFSSYIIVKKKIYASYWWPTMNEMP